MHLACHRLLRGCFVLLVLAAAVRPSSAGTVTCGPDPDIATTSGSPPDATVAAYAPSDSLAPTWQPPWNPSSPIPRRRPWEQAVLLPGRVVTLPFSLLGAGVRHGLLVLENDNRLPISYSPMTNEPKPSGVRIDTPHLGDRVGPGLAIEAFSNVWSSNLQSRWRARYTGTLHQYNSTSVWITGNPAQLEYGYDWRPEENFYGVGASSASGARSDFASQTQFVRGQLRFGWNRGERDSLPRTQLAMWGGPRTAVVRTGREPGIASFEQTFPDLAASSLDRTVDNLVYGARVSTDSRNGRPHWTRGSRLLLQGERFDVPVRALALSSASERGARFTRMQIEGETGFSFWHDPRTVRLFVRVVDQNVDSGADRFLISDLATLGGKPGLGGFHPGRFHDFDLVVGRATYIFPLGRRLEMDLHSEWGQVAHDVWKDTRLSDLETSYGFAVRGRVDTSVLGSLGMDFSREGARVRYTLGGTP
jgi:hypothetical protein